MKERPMHMRDLIATADAARDRKDWSEAARLYGEAVKRDPTLHHLRVQLGHAHKESGDLVRAAMAYYTTLEYTPRDDDLHLQIGHLERLRGDGVKAEACYRKSVELNPANGRAVLALVELKLPEMVEAVIAKRER